MPDRNNVLNYRGNLDLFHRPSVKNPDGSESSVRSMTVGFGDKTYLIPTVAEDGSGILSEEDAIDQFRRTGKHLGIFDSVGEGERASQDIHKQQEVLMELKRIGSRKRAGAARIGALLKARGGSR